MQVPTSPIASICITGLVEIIWAYDVDLFKLIAICRWQKVLVSFAQNTETEISKMIGKEQK